MKNLLLIGSLSLLLNSPFTITNDLISVKSANETSIIGDINTYNSEIIGLSHGDIISNNRINCIYKDNVSDITKDMYYNFKIINRDNNTITSNFYDYSLKENDYKENKEIKNILGNGKYLLEITAFELTDFPKNYKSNTYGTMNSRVKEDMQAAKGYLEYNKKVISFEIKSDSKGSNTPSNWAKKYINMGILYTPYSLDSNYQAKLTKKESIDLLLSFYKNYFNNIYSFNMYEGSVIKKFRYTNDNAFSSTNNITKEEFAIMLINMIRDTGYETQGEYLSKFRDYKNITNSSKEAISFLNKNEIITGLRSNFNPKDFITREEAIVIIVKLGDYINSLFENKY
ncbi:S-layer homology domain-containing protein [Dethiothermospora halolimnae]|uniref:S-layer homology domain-containing protein n=1 Tax=Dethiothermospora halolimnae TaxID=3114390 RepID=UPI003CCBBC18